MGFNGHIMDIYIYMYMYICIYKYITLEWSNGDSHTFYGSSTNKHDGFHGDTPGISWGNAMEVASGNLWLVDV